ncbi:WD40 repeat-containing protein SMU1 [Babesia microti strain RI]|uniref:WD40 repeat-containing protein SMU1 n=1 Tax=Babesia microti (strain RI) TaxID=1133968 RepID=I7IPW0_BABMR|nr:WD40 repeat-containing protein SMU1 [Babesia microti strain RI]CCF73265.1 WD40 repeat-containing protein SMU1 [Babesia microti strain RI]|eukprot:XP_012647874.1 WD40 repeat-containing protein SMU1 [Babesia microti strain RI]
MAGRVEVASTDILKLILQFLKENNYTKSLKLLQKESHVSFNGLTSIDNLLMDIQHGRWNNVLDTIATMELSESLLFLIYEQIIFELVELREFDLSNSILQTSIPLQIMSSRESLRYSRLQEVCKKQQFDPKDLFNMDISSFKRRRRAEISAKISNEIEIVPPSRLLEIIGMAIKWQKYQGIIRDSTSFNILSGKVSNTTNVCCLNVSKVIKFAENSHPECAIFTPNGQHLITGSSDGFIEVWDYHSGKLNLELDYQKEDRMMMHDCLVMSLAVSTDSHILASGDKNGNIRVWKLIDGKCVRKFNQVHNGAVICITFSRDSLSLLTGSFDRTARIHGLKSGTTIKEFRGHKSFVNAVLYNYKGNRIVTGGSDGYIKVWDSNTAQCITTFAPPDYSTDNELISSDAKTVLKAISSLFFTRNELLWVTCGQRVVYLMDLSGNLVKKIPNDENPTLQLSVSCVSGDGEWIYSLGNDDSIHAFSTTSTDHNIVPQAHSGEGIGLVHHPSQSLLVSFGSDSKLKIYVS